MTRATKIITKKTGEECFSCLKIAMLFRLIYYISENHNQHKCRLYTLQRTLYPPLPAYLLPCVSNGRDSV